MSKKFENLKKKLAEAGSENDMLAALDGYSGELTDEEVMSIFGGDIETSDNSATEDSAYRNSFTNEHTDVFRFLE